MQMVWGDPIKNVTISNRVDAGSMKLLMPYPLRRRSIRFFHSLGAAQASSWRNVVGRIRALVALSITCAEI